MFKPYIYSVIKHKRLRRKNLTCYSSWLGITSTSSVTSSNSRNEEGAHGDILGVFFILDFLFLRIHFLQDLLTGILEIKTNNIFMITSLQTDCGELNMSSTLGVGMRHQKKHY